MCDAVESRVRGHRISRNVSGLRGIRRPGAEAGPLLV